MLDRIAAHPFFKPWTDPTSGIVSHILSERIAPVQFPFYFVNSSVSADEKWLWFLCAHPPTTAKCLGVLSLDPEKPFARIFHSSYHHAETPLIDEGGTSCLFGQETGVYRQHLDGRVDKVITLPDEIMKGRRLIRIATHLTKSADGKYLVLDGAFSGDVWFIALAKLATGKVTQLMQFTRHYNHAQFSTTDPTLFTIAQDWWHDARSGEAFGFDQRIWLMDTKKTCFEPLRPADWFGHGTAAAHEWWDAQGRVCWVDYGTGVFRLALDTRELEHVWKKPLCHAHSHASGRYFCADESPYKWDKQPCEVLFYDAATKREVAVASALPKPIYPRSPLHLDPHPRFTPRDTAITYMTTALGAIDLAIVPVAQLIVATG